MTDIENKNIIEDPTATTGLISNKDKTKPRKIKKDPTKIQHVELSEDFYALTWMACRKKSWENVEVAGVKITLTDKNDTNLFLGFFLFIGVVCATVGVLLYESFATDAYKDANWPIVILRITLVCFAQQKLKPEIYQGMTLLRYSLQKPNSFIHPSFAKFIGFCQASIAILTFCAIFLFCCMADQALDLIMNFAGLAVISELDDWVGEQIMAEKLHSEYEGVFKNANLDTENLNERMSLFTKLSLIGEDAEIIDDQNKDFSDSSLLNFLITLSEYLPWGLVPLLTIPCQYILVFIQDHAHVAK